MAGKPETTTKAHRPPDEKLRTASRSVLTVRLSCVLIISADPRAVQGRHADRRIPSGSLGGARALAGKLRDPGIRIFSRKENSLGDIMPRKEGAVRILS